MVKDTPTCAHTHKPLATTPHIVMKTSIWLPFATYTIISYHANTKGFKMYSITHVLWKGPAWKFSQGSYNTNSNSKIQLNYQLSVKWQNSPEVLNTDYTEILSLRQISEGESLLESLEYFFLIHKEWNCLCISSECMCLEQYSFH